MKEWYTELGFYANPFTLNPFRGEFKIYGREKEIEELYYRILAANMAFIEGEKGSGKTMLLRSIMDKFKGKIIYINAAKLKKTLDIEKILNQKYGIRGNLFNIKPKNMILMLDNVEELSILNLERIKYYFDQNHLRSVIFSGRKYNEKDFPDSIKSRIGNRITTLKPIKDKDAIEVILDRLDQNDDDSIIPTEIIKELYNDYSNKNVGQLLLNAYRVCEEMSDNGDEKVTKEHLKVLKKAQDIDNKILNEVFEVEISPNEENIVKVGKYYRDTETDTFCANCGAIVNVTDAACPECFAEFENAVEEDA